MEVSTKRQDWLEMLCITSNTVFLFYVTKVLFSIQCFRAKCDISALPRGYCLFGLVVRRPPRERKIPGSNPACARILSGSSHTSDSKIGTPVATLPGAWRYRVSAGTGRPSVSIQWLGEVESLICSFYLSVAAHEIVWADPSLRCTRMLLGCQATNQQTNPRDCRNILVTKG